MKKILQCRLRLADCHFEGYVSVSFLHYSFDVLQLEYRVFNSKLIVFVVQGVSIGRAERSQAL